MTVGRPCSLDRVLLASAGGITLWLLVAFLWHIGFGNARLLPNILFLDQDLPALLMALIALVGFVAARWRHERHEMRLPLPRARIVLPIIGLLALASWAGHYLIFQDYALSRDEEVAELAAAYLRDGLIARPIPLEWLDYRRAIMPEFFSAFGADRFWASAYLPFNSAIRALFWHLGDPNLSGPALLAIGLFALWRVAARLFPDRPDAQWVVLLLAFSSAQLSVTAMTPFAMTGHFALNMVWLALVLRGGWLGHAGAGLVALAVAGLHQWHFPPIFIGPFLLWFALGRRWGALAFHALVLALLVLLWAKLWPGFLLEQLGPPADVRPAAGVADKVGSLIDRVAEKWQPLLNLSRFLAWNNILMVPLAIVGTAGIDWRQAIRGKAVALPLALGCLAGCALALPQGYGWGYRYVHGFIGPFCLLAGFGWLRLGNASWRPVLMSVAIALLTATFLLWRTHAYVAPYAASHRLIRSAPADVVLVDPRGGMFVTDLVRGHHGDIGRPVVMNLTRLDAASVAQLCGRYSIAIFDRSAFAALGVPGAGWRDGPTALLRDEMRARGCGTPLTVNPASD